MQLERSVAVLALGIILNMPAKMYSVLSGWCDPDNSLNNYRTGPQSKPVTLHTGIESIWVWALLQVGESQCVAL